MRRKYLIATSTCGSGKVTIARRVMQLFILIKMYRVRPLKIGLDDIDTKFHATMYCRPSIKIDTFMSTHKHLRKLYEMVFNVKDGHLRHHSLCNSELKTHNKAYNSLDDISRYYIIAYLPMPNNQQKYLIHKTVGRRIQMRHFPNITGVEFITFYLIFSKKQYA